MITVKKIWKSITILREDRARRKLYVEYNLLLSKIERCNTAYDLFSCKMHIRLFDKKWSRSIIPSPSSIFIKVLYRRYGEKLINWRWSN
jgi:hypothetical protein